MQNFFLRSSSSPPLTSRRRWSASSGKRPACPRYLFPRRSPSDQMAAVATTVFALHGRVDRKGPF
jgi:hypothetical protein